METPDIQARIEPVTSRSDERQGLYQLRLRTIGHFRVPPGPLYENEVKCSAFDMEVIFYSHANKTHFHKTGCTLSLTFKVRGPIQVGINFCNLVYEG